MESKVYIMILVCGEYTTETAPQDKTPEDEAVLFIYKVHINEFEYYKKSSFLAPK